MATPTDAGMSLVHFESKRRELALSLLVQSERFMDLDNQINESLVRITRSVADFLSEHPEVLRASADQRTLAEALERQGGVAAGAGDVTGSGVIDSLLGTIGDILTGEKEFIKEIVRKIFGL